MSYNRALQLARQHREEYEYQNHVLRNGLISRNMNFNPNAQLGIAGLSVASRMAAIGSTGATSGLLAMPEVAKAAGLGMMATLPLRQLTQTNRDNKRLAELKAEETALKYDPKNINFSDIVKTAGLAQSSISKGAMNAGMALSIAGAMTGNHSLSNAGLYGMGLSGLTGGPLRALTAASGFGAKAYGAMGGSAMGLKAGALGAANPIMLGMGMLPGVLAKGAGATLSGAGSLAGLFGTGHVGGTIGAAGAALSSGGSSMLALSAANPVVGAIAGAITVAMASPMVSKLMAKVTEKASGQQLLKSGPSMRPRIDSAGDIQKKYTLTSFLDNQSKIMVMSGRASTSEGISWGYYSAMEKHLAGIGFITEYIQGIQADKVQSSNTSQNNMQIKFGHSGNARGDLTSRYEGPEEPDTWLGRRKQNLLRGLVGLSKSLTVGGNFLNPLNYLKGGDSSPFAKYREMQNEDKLEHVVNKVSTLTGIPTSFLTALETSATSLANLGETSADKTVMLLGGIHELTRFSSFRLQDIATALGVEEENSLMNKINNAMNAIDNAQDREEAPKSRFEQVIDTMSGSGVTSIAGAGLGMLLGGPAGALAGIAATGGISNSANWVKDKLARRRGDISTTEELADDAVNTHSLPTSGIGINSGTTINNTINNNAQGPVPPTTVDDRQIALLKASEELKFRSKQMESFDSIIDIHKLTSKNKLGAYVRFNKKAEKAQTKHDKKQLKYLKEIASNTSSISTRMLACCLKGGLGGGGGSGRKKGRFLRGGAGVVGAGMLAYNMLSDDDGSDTITGRALSYGLNGALIGAAIPVPFGMAIGGALGTVYGGASAYMDGASWFGGDNKTKTKTKMMPTIDIKPNDYYMDHSGTVATNIVLPDLENVLSADTGYANNFKIDSNGNYTPPPQIINMTTKDNDNSTVRKYIDNQSKDIVNASPGGDPFTIDTPKEMVMLLNGINDDQRNLGQLSTTQQNAIIELLQGMISTIGQGNQAMTSFLGQIASSMTDTTQPMGNH